MIIEIFDDKLSIIHVIAGVLTYFVTFVFVIFIFYELTEFCYRYETENVSKFVGDFVEYLFGLSLITLLIQIISVIV